MIDTKEVRKYWRKNVDLICPGALNEIVDLCDELDALRKDYGSIFGHCTYLEGELDALRKPVEGIERPDVVDTLLENAAGRRLLEATNEVLDYILALEAENRKLREYESRWLKNAEARAAIERLRIERLEE